MMGLDAEKYKDFIFCDASHLTKDKVTEYRAVDHNGVEIFRGSTKFSSSNVGEYIGLVYAIGHCVLNNLPRKIYCDSLNAIRWLNERQSGSQFDFDELNTVDMKVKCLSSIIDTFEIRHFNKRVEGFENPADFGRK